MRWLYIKRCSHCDLLYFGTTTKSDVVAYQGSGYAWTQHLRDHNARAITLQTRRFRNKDSELCKKVAVEFSKRYDIVASSRWANLKTEIGTEGGLDEHREETKCKIANALSGRIWYHDPKSQRGYHVKPGDARIRRLGLKRGQAPKHVASVRLSRQDPAYRELQRSKHVGKPTGRTNKGATGLSWYNDGVKSYRLPTDCIESRDLYEGRAPMQPYGKREHKLILPKHQGAHK